MSVDVIFVVGNSRSGTTMMGQILAGSDAIFTFEEIHFFEQLWDPTKQLLPIPRHQAERLGARLLTIQRDGYYTQKNPDTYLSEARKMLQDISEPVTPPLVYSAMLQYETLQAGKQIPCDQTPRNLLYLKEIFALFPQACVINMIRDPRDVLLSQKNRWRRRFLGSKVSMPLKESLRSWSNYHPITISMLWNSGIKAVESFADHPRIFNLRFEDLVSEPECHVRQVCAFLEIEFQPKMLHVPHIGSSHDPDHQNQTGIRPEASGRWKKESSNHYDLAVCQHFTTPHLIKYRYEVSEELKAGLGDLFWAILTWPLKMSIAFFFNWYRVRNLPQAVRRRLG